MQQKNTVLPHTHTHTHTQRYAYSHTAHNGVKQTVGECKWCHGSSLQPSKSRAFSLNGRAQFHTQLPLSWSGEKVTPETQQKHKCTKAGLNTRKMGLSHTDTHGASFQSHSSYGYWLPNPRAPSVGGLCMRRVPPFLKNVFHVGGGGVLSSLFERIWRQQKHPAGV